MIIILVNWRSTGRMEALKMRSITPENPVKRGRHEINIDHIRTYASAIRPVSDWEKEKYREPACRIVFPGCADDLHGRSYRVHIDCGTTSADGAACGDDSGAGYIKK